MIQDMREDPVTDNSKILRWIETGKPICLAIPRNKKHTSLIVRKSQLVSVGDNSFKGHPLAQKIGYRFEEQHSELNALLRMPKKDWDKLILINLRFNAKGDMRMARPCKLCQPWCNAIFDEIHYTCPDGCIRRLLSSNTQDYGTITSLQNYYQLS